MEYSLVHSVPGRFRLRVPALHGNEALAGLVTSWLKTEPGITDVRVNILCASLVVNFRRQSGTAWMSKLQSISVAALRKAPPADSTTQVAPVKPAEPQRRAFWKSLIPLAIATAGAALSITSWPLAMPVAIGLVALSATQIWTKAGVVLIREKRLNVDFLDGLAVIVGLIQGDLFTAAFMIWLIAIGDYIRERTAAKSKRSIHELLDYQSKKAWVIREGHPVQLPVNDIVVGDVVAIYPGNLIPVDGTVIAGRASVDQRTITGESMPVSVEVNASVYAGTVVSEGKLRVRAVRVGSETSAAKIVELIETAPITETRVQNYAEKFADRLVAPWLGASIVMFAATANVQRLFSMLMIDYGTGIRVAAPTSVLASMTAAAHRGILIKSGAHMEKLAQADTFVFDKTGTLTRGVPEVVDVVSYDEQHFPKMKILQVAASAEARLRHPIAEAIVARAMQTSQTLEKRSGSKYQVGMGIEAQVNGYYVHVGSSRFLKQSGIRFDHARRDLHRLSEQGCSTVLLAVDGQLKGVIACADEVRQESPELIRSLHERGVKNAVMITGDNTAAAACVARRLGIDRCYAEMLPADKAAIVCDLQKEGRVVAMVGDGINDSPALAYADVGISMKHGADVAQETADVVLMENSLHKLVEAVDISRGALKLVKQNFGIIAGFNTLALALVLPTGLVSPAVTALISNGSAILASMNAIRPLVMSQ